MFEFNGLLFRKCRNFKNDAEATALLCGKGRVKQANFDYEGFYRKAKEAGEVYDIYYVGNTQCIPCSRTLFELDNKKDYPFEELGYFTEKEIESLKRKLNGKTYMNFEIASSNNVGNHILILRTDYDDTPSNIRRFFLGYVFSELARG